MFRSTEVAFVAALVAAIILVCETRKSKDSQKVVIDTDSGADDAMAILMMLSIQSRANILAITTVRGNTGVENVTRDVLLILQVAKRTEIPVYMGSPQGLVYEQNSSNYFGFDGLGDFFDKPPLDGKQDGHAATAIANLVKEHPGEISLLCTGPLTNLAIAMHLNPHLLHDLKEVIVLGGSYKGRGNMGPQIEFNIYMDPEAAAFVFSNVPKSKLITLIPIETVEDNAKFTKSWRLNDLGQTDSSFIKFLNMVERKALSYDDGSWLAFDPTAASILLDPTIVTSQVSVWVEVETGGRFSRGAMVRDQETDATNVRIVTEIDKYHLEVMLRSYLKNKDNLKIDKFCH